MSLVTFEIKLVAAVVLVGAAYYAATKAARVAEHVVKVDLNPFDSNNIVNRNVIPIYQQVTGSKGTIGTDIYDFFHPTFPVNVRGTPYFDPSKRETDWEGNPVTVASDWNGIGS